jgi:HNH endonuclease
LAGKRSKTKCDFSLDQLKEKLLYIPETGLFYYSGKPRPKIKIGAICGTLRKDGYLSTTLNNKEYLLHRLAYLWCFGYLPSDEVDHIDGNKVNNKIDNLRIVTRTQNNQNRIRAGTNSSTGVLGVRTHKDKFIASLRHNKQSVYLGIFETAEIAYNAYVEAKRKLHEACTI